MLLTFEYNLNGVVEVFMDEEGREFLIRTLETLSTADSEIDHDHLMTPAWAGVELTEEVQNTDNELINKVTIFLIRNGRSASITTTETANVSKGD